jgi:tetratricopeptide (TPR) repeat protein
MKWQLKVLFLGLIWAAVASAQEQPDKLAAVLAEARALINEGKASSAIEKLLASSQPTEPRIAHMLGIAYYHAKDHLRAIEQLTAAAGKLPEGSLERREAIQVLGLSHYLAGHLAESIPLLEQTRAWVPANSELAYVLGMAYVQTRQPAKARNSFARMFRVSPDSAAAHLLTAQMMTRVEFEEYAEVELKQAVEKDPKLPHVHFLLGQIAIFRGRLEEGIALMERELELNPGDAMAFYRLGDAYARQLNWDEAIVALQKSIWLNPYNSGPYILLGKAYMKKHQLDAAEGMLRRAIQYDPNNKLAHYLLAQVLQQMGLAQESKREFEAAERLQSEPDR